MMNKKLFETIDRMKEQERYHIAREVGYFLNAIDHRGRWEDEDEPIAICQEIFVHLYTANLPDREMANAVVDKVCTRPADDKSRVREGVLETIVKARLQFRDYLPYTI